MLTKAHRRIRMAVVVGAALPRQSTQPTRRPRRGRRPSDGAPGAASEQYAPNGLAIYNDYATPERLFAGRGAVVHYVTTA